MAIDISASLDFAEKVFRVLAYLLGAAWIYFNFFKGRTYRPRLEITVDGRLARRETPELVTAVVKVKNVGLSKVDIAKRGTAVRILAFDQSEKDNWKHLTTVGILERHSWIEPNETIEDHVAYASALAATPAVKIEAIIVGAKTMREAVTIVV